MMADLVRVLVRTSSLFEGCFVRSKYQRLVRRQGQACPEKYPSRNLTWYTTPIMRVLRVQPSDAQAKLPESRRRARYLWFPPRVRTVWIRLAPMRVFAGWRAFSKARFFPVVKRSERTSMALETCLRLRSHLSMRNALLHRRSHHPDQNDTGFRFTSGQRSRRHTVESTLGTRGTALVSRVTRKTHSLMAINVS